MRQRLPGEERRRLIIDAAADLFSKHGLKGTTTREVAKAVGISEATIFKHFATKEELYTAIIETKTQTQQVLGAIGPLADARDDAALLRTLATELIERTQSDPTLMRLSSSAGVFRRSTFFSVGILRIASRPARSGRRTRSRRRGISLAWSRSTFCYTNSSGRSHRRT
jgi:AcrR family transcriptional regulator